MPSVPVKTSSSSYAVTIQPDAIGSLARSLHRLHLLPPVLYVVTSPAIWKHWRARFEKSFLTYGTKIHPLFVLPGERYKRLSTIERLAEELSHAGARRDALLVAFGGGVIGDMTGFLAAIYMRGIRYMQVPTTYLAQIDSSVGGKTGVNLRVGKNLVGSFHHPVAVLCDPSVLSTLPQAELRAGLVESVKAAVLGDARFFGWLERNLPRLLRREQSALSHAVVTSVRIKAKIVSADEKESGQRMLLNLGHTVGHAIEAATGYKQLLHGEAVAWGIVAALRLSCARGTLSSQQAERIEALLFRLGPFRGFRATADALLRRTYADKKHLTTVSRFILPLAAGKAAVVEDVRSEELRTAIAAMLRTVEERGA